MGSGAPSYVAGAHACSGTAATLNPNPTRTSTTPTVASGPRRGSSAAAWFNRPKWTVPVAAYSSAAPSSVIAVATTLTTKNVTAASAEATKRRRSPTRAYSGSVSVSTATIRLTRSRAAPSTTPPVIEHASRKQYSPGGRVRTTPADSASRGHGGIYREQRDMVDVHFATASARARAASADRFTTVAGSRPSASARTTRGPQERSSALARPAGASRTTAGAAGPWVTLRNSRRKYAAASAAPSAARTASTVQPRRNAATTANASPQNPASPGSPSDAIAAYPSSPASPGAVSRSPPSSVSEPVCARS